LHIGDFFWNYIDVNRSPKILNRREDEQRIEEEMMRWMEDPSEQKNKSKSRPITFNDKTEEVIDRSNKNDN
jgi:hypothetical protein